MSELLKNVLGELLPRGSPDTFYRMHNPPPAHACKCVDVSFYIGEGPAGDRTYAKCNKCGAELGRIG